MKTTSIALAFSFILGASTASFGEKVRFEDLPSDVQTKIRAQTGSASINDIDKTTRDGKTVYEVGFKQPVGLRGEQQKEMRFDEQGRLLNRDGSSALTAGKVTWDQLPEAVKKVAQTRMQKASVNDIDRQIKNGQAAYEIGFRSNGAQQELLISDEGKILRDVQLPQELLSGLNNAGAATGNLSSTPVQLAGGTKIELNQAPPAVQTAITSAAGGARIEDVERGTWNGRPVYQAGFKSGGQHVELQITEEGRILHDPRGATGRPAESVTGRASSKYSDVTSRVPLSAAQKVERRSLPAAVERALTAHASNAEIQDIERGLWRSGPVYEIAFKDNGQHVELQIDENGEIVFDPRTASR